MSEYGYDNTEILAHYLTSMLIQGCENARMPANIPLDILEECQFAAKLIVQAIQNHSKSYLEI